MTEVNDAGLLADEIGSATCENCDTEIRGHDDCPNCGLIGGKIPERVSAVTGWAYDNTREPGK